MTRFPASYTAPRKVTPVERLLAYARWQAGETIPDIAAAMELTAQEVAARAVVLLNAVECGDEVDRLLNLAIKYLERLASRPAVGARQTGTHIFIGHGRSALWREFKDFIQDDLKLPWDEFSRVPVAGSTIVDRLVEMLDGAALAFLILTAEDERAAAGAEFAARAAGGNQQHGVHPPGQTH